MQLRPGHTISIQHFSPVTRKCLLIWGKSSLTQINLCISVRSMAFLVTLALCLLNMILELHFLDCWLPLTCKVPLTLILIMVDPLAAPLPPLILISRLSLQHSHSQQHCSQHHSTYWALSHIKMTTFRKEICMHVKHLHPLKKFWLPENIVLLTITVGDDQTEPKDQAYHQFGVPPHPQEI